MRPLERVQAVADYGLTDRQARFVVLVMQHSGLCVKRQYAAFAGIATGGEKCNAFFGKLVRRAYAITSDCIHNRARLYHIHHKPLYHAIGDPESRYRRAVPARQAAERLWPITCWNRSPATCRDECWSITRTFGLTRSGRRSTRWMCSAAGCCPRPTTVTIQRAATKMQKLKRSSRSPTTSRHSYVTV